MVNPIPSFDFYKKIEGELSFDFQRLEKSYNDYDANLPHRHNYYEIIFFDNAGGEHEVDFKKLPITAFTAHIISPEQVHVLRRQKNVNGYVISFSPDLFLSISQNIGFIETFPFFLPANSLPTVQFSKNNTKQFLDILSELELEFNSNHLNKKEMLAFLTGQMLLFLKRNYQEPENSNTENNLTIRFRKLVKQHFLNLFSVTDYAGILSVTAGHLNDTVKKASGKTAKGVIDEQRILEAKRLLYHSQFSVKEIAAYLNFEEPSYFNRFFRKHTGTTPVAFRQSIRKKYH